MGDNAIAHSPQANSAGKAAARSLTIPGNALAARRATVKLGRINAEEANANRPAAQAVTIDDVS